MPLEGLFLNGALIVEAALLNHEAVGEVLLHVRGQFSILGSAVVYIAIGFVDERAPLQTLTLGREPQPS